MAVQPTKITKLYKGSVEIGFFENQHRYSLIKDGKADKEWITSVTSATGMIDKSRVLIRWAINLAKDHLVDNLDNLSIDIIEEACNLHNVKREEAASKGSIVHSWIEAHIKNEDPDLPEDENVVAAINAFLDWEKEHKVKWLATEQIVYSKKYDYVGLLDALAIIDGKKMVIDFKTSNGVYNDYRYQVSAYRAAYEEETGEKLTGDSRIIRFDKETALFEVYECSDHDKDFEAFKGALAIKKREKELDKLWRANNK